MDKLIKIIWFSVIIIFILYEFSINDNVFVFNKNEAFEIKNDKNLKSNKLKCDDLKFESKLYNDDFYMKEINNVRKEITTLNDVYLKYIVKTDNYEQNIGNIRNLKNKIDTLINRINKVINIFYNSIIVDSNEHIHYIDKLDNKYKFVRFIHCKQNDEDEPNVIKYSDFKNNMLDLKKRAYKNVHSIGNIKKNDNNIDNKKAYKSALESLVRSVIQLQGLYA